MGAQIRGVILDVDGTLVDSNDAHASAWVQAFAEAGQLVEFAKVRNAIGMGSDKLLPHVAGIDADSELGRRLSEARKAIFQEQYLPHIEAFPGTRDLLKKMRAAGLRLAVASSAAPEELDPLLRIAGADDLIAAQTSASEVANSKPDPDVVQAALSKLGYKPEEVLMLGDTPYDLGASTGAQVGLVALRCGGWQDDAFPGAVAVYDDPAHLLACWQDAPFSQAD